MSISTEQIKQLREATGAGVLDCRAALEEAKGDMEKAKAILRAKGLDKAAKRAGRAASDGVVELYSHGGGRVGVMVEVNCETDFVARSEAFRNLAHEIALHIAASAPEWLKKEDVPQTRLDTLDENKVDTFLDEKVLLRQAYVRDDAKTIHDLISESIGTIGENIVVRRFARWELGESLESDAKTAN
ncbi:MAG: translation elongation factor Ts [Anaerolineales bacterium]